MNAKIEQEIKGLMEHLNNNTLTVEECLEERFTIRKMASIASSIPDYHAVKKAHDAVEEAMLRAKIRANMERNVVKGSAPVQKKNKDKKALESQIQEVQRDLKTKEGEVADLKAKVEASEKNGRELAVETSKILEENVKLQEEIEKLKRQASINTAALEKCQLESEELAMKLFVANTLAESEQASEIAPMAESGFGSLEDLDLIDKLDDIGFRQYL